MWLSFSKHIDYKCFYIYFLISVVPNQFVGLPVPSSSTIHLPCCCGDRRVFRWCINNLDYSSYVITMSAEAAGHTHQGVLVFQETTKLQIWAQESRWTVLLLFPRCKRSKFSLVKMAFRLRLKWNSSTYWFLIIMLFTVINLLFYSKMMRVLGVSPSLFSKQIALWTCVSILTWTAWKPLWQFVCFYFSLCFTQWLLWLGFFPQS